MVENLKGEVDQKINSLLEIFYKTVTYADHLATGKEINKEYFIRHTVETILRIRLARVADAQVLDYLTINDPVSAAKWAQYTADEMLHDKLFLKDLKKFSIGKKAIYATEPLFATKLLQGFLYYTIKHEGAIGLLSKAYFLEYASYKTQPIWNKNIEMNMGREYVQGANNHISIDEKEDHSEFVWNVLKRQINNKKDEEKVMQNIGIFYSLFAMYFEELYSVVLKGRHRLKIDLEI